MKNTNMIFQTILRNRASVGAMLIALAALSGSSIAAHADTSDNTSMSNTSSNDARHVANSGVVVHNKALDEAVQAKLDYCQQNYHSCKQATDNAAGVLVFPSVVKADLIIGGAGGKGALIEHGKITGYYSIGAGSVGVQAGYQNASQIYVFPTKSSLKALKNGSEWHVGDTVGVTARTH